MRGLRHIFRLLPVLLVLILAPPGAALADSPWDALARFRQALEERDRFAAAFTQSYRPAGFGNAEEESGRLVADLPACLRWDYDEPFPKSFLVCDQTLWYWSPGESRGERYRLDGEEAPGLDFLLLDLDTLQRRYDARLDRLAGDGARIVLTPVRPTADLVEAAVELDPTHRQLRALEYLDAEGNRTRFELGSFDREVPGDVFTPPDDLEWEEP